MELVIEEFGQAILALVAGSEVTALFLWLLEMITSY